MTTRQMTIGELTKLTQETEKAIQDLLISYHKNTGVIPERVGFNIAETTTSETFKFGRTFVIVDVKLRITL